MERGEGGGRPLATPAPQVFLGEVNSGISSTQVVVKELKASASVQEQVQFLEEAQPYRWVAPGGRGRQPAGGWATGPRSPGASAPPAGPPGPPARGESGASAAPAGPCSTATCSSAWPSAPR